MAHTADHEPSLSKRVPYVVCVESTLVAAVQQPPFLPIAKARGLSEDLMTPTQERRLLAWIALCCWGFIAGIVVWIIQGMWLRQ